ncbi:unnamed protein product, partial [Prorocentrum cordatum]
QALENFEFPVVSMFQRWMFQQERGTDVVPWAILVVGWREAQPCINHVEAAATENFAGLRQDAQRSLRAATGEPDGTGEVRVAVSTAIIVVENWLQHARAATWVARKVSGKGAARPCPVSIVLAHGRDDLRAAILAAAGGPQGPAAPPKALARAELGAPEHAKGADSAAPGAAEVACEA